VEHFRYAARLLPNISVAFWALGDAYASLGFDALATENYQHAIRVDPNDKVAKRKWKEWVESLK
jgi:tetratricopeptide (TPR) repeat protein